MKRMITQELINLVEDMVKSGTIGDLIAQKVHLQDLDDLTYSDLGALFPTPENDKLLAWDGGVLKNVDFPVSFTHSLNELDDTLKALCESAVSDTVACSEAQWTAIRNLLDKSLYFYYAGYTMIKQGGYYPGSYVFSSKTANNGASLEFEYSEETLSIIFAEA